MKRIYIILTQTGTILSRLSKMATKKTYNHVSIALDYDLKEMYSFGRLNPYIFFWGGFVHEGIDFGTFRRFKNTQAKVLFLDVSDEEYDAIRTRIEYFIENSKFFKFNIKGLFYALRNKNLERSNKYYCSQFVKYMLKQAQIKGGELLPDCVKPQDFEDIEGVECCYTGLLKTYLNDR